jgi:predicted transcriptional regulator
VKIKLTVEKIKSIPELIESGKTRMEVSELLGVSSGCVDYWIKRLKTSGYVIKAKRGPRPIEL